MSRVVCVTGGASGIGAATVERFRADGDRVWCLDRTETTGDRTLAVDVRDSGAVTQAVDSMTDPLQLLS